MSIDLTIPEIGESVTEAFISKWMKSEGDSVRKDETIAELESEKANFELPSPVTGTLAKILKQEGESAEVGEVIGRMEEGEGSDDTQRAEQDRGADQHDGRGGDTEIDEAEAKAEEGAGDRGSKDTEEQRDKPGGGPVSARPRIMPAARRALAEHDLRADEVRATGPGGRLLKEDVLRHVQERRSSREDRPQPPPQEEQGDREEQSVPMSPMRQTIARRLVEAQQNAALLTTFNEVDMSAVMDLRARHRDAFQEAYDAKLGFMSFFVKASVDALKRFPGLNAEIRDTSIVYRNYHDIGIAISTKRGLVVPVLRDAGHLSFSEVEGAIAEFASRADAGRIEPEDLEGGTFTITNGGVFGSLLSTPIVNPPQSGILGMHAIQDRPVAVDKQVVVRPMMYLALTYDHRIVDGREAVLFLRRIKEAIEEPARMLLEV
ncbi:MAG TPA: 2-oxoglutarate dehydrogenase complex dihydrolipoyllysine-residue succinyltransferase [Candidatus Methylomirabilis sp.]